jgi:uncharacterized protein (UPF0276 family)
MRMSTFMMALHRETGCRCTLDVGHLVAYCHQFGLPADEEFGAFFDLPLADIHMSGLRCADFASGSFWLDAHDQPLSMELMAWFERAVKQCDRSVRMPVVTTEQEEAPTKVFRDNLAQVRKVLEESGHERRLSV